MLPFFIYDSITLTSKYFIALSTFDVIFTFRFREKISLNITPFLKKKL